MAHIRSVMAPFWLNLWACTLALGWLLPNHHRPWTAFHADAWVALTLLLAAATVIFRSRVTLLWHKMPILVTLLVFIPWTQYSQGLVSQIGNVWITSAYLLGLSLALVIGANWEANSPGQLADALFLAVGVASVLSVGLQLYQWLHLDGLALWTLGGGHERPFANLGQPNQLATLLLWGVLAAAWGFLRGYVGAKAALLMAIFLLFGVALTASRTAWLAVVGLVCASWLWRRFWKSRQVAWVASGLALYFLICVVGIGWLQTPTGGTLNETTLMRGDLRSLAWLAFLDAAWRAPLWGYGWNQIASAQMAVAADHPALHVIFLHSHNLFLDLILWCGVPLGLLTSVCLLAWFWRRLKAVNNAENLVLMLFLLVVANHALLELPLHHAYFLLPTGMVIGVLNTRLNASVMPFGGQKMSVVLWLATTLLLVLVIRDYIRIERSYEVLRLEWARIKIQEPAVPPDVILLTQWRDYIQYVRSEPKAGLKEDDLNQHRLIASLSPDVVTLTKLATTLVLNDRPDEAKMWLRKMCKVVTEEQCHSAKMAWNLQVKKYPQIEKTSWPLDNQ